MIGVLWDVLITQCVGAGGNRLAAVVRGPFGKGHDTHELPVAEIRIQCAGSAGSRSGQSAGEPEIGGPAIVESDVVALVLHGLLNFGGGTVGLEWADAIYR